MSAQHTPGPWFPTKDSQHNEVARIGRAWNISTRLPLSEFGHPNADARLIAAAPDLLEALIAVRDRKHTPDLWEMVNAAIAKATGAQQ